MPGRPLPPMAASLITALLVLCLVTARLGMAQTGLAGHDPSLPIEIAADQLTVEQAKRQAVFAGNVEAVQGDVTLRAERLVVHYDLGSEQTASRAVRRIEAAGDVVIASPEESAKADRAVYDVQAGTIVLEGSVVLARGEDVVRGGRLDIDLRAQTAVMQAAGQERVRALFHASEPAKQGG